jgi:hypothetical protein
MRIHRRNIVSTACLSEAEIKALKMWTTTQTGLNLSRAIRECVIYTLTHKDPLEVARENGAAGVRLIISDSFDVRIIFVNRRTYHTPQFLGVIQRH